jgi:hypothetical protein
MCLALTARPLRLLPAFLPVAQVSIDSNYAALVVGVCVIGE